MGSDIAVYLLTVYYCCCCLATQRVAAADGCSPEFPSGDSARRGAQAAGTEGTQVLVPSYVFSCNGRITTVLIGADSTMAGDDGFVFQLWRPQNDGTYTLVWSVDTSGATQRVGPNKLNFTTSIPVMSGDSIGYRLQPVEGLEMHFLIDNSNESGQVEILTRSTSEVVCQLSPYDSLYTARKGSAPLISVEFVEFVPTQPPLQPQLSCTMTKFTASSVLSTPDTTSKASPSPPPVIADEESKSGTDSMVLGAILGATLLLLVFIVTITAILLCLRQRRRKIPQLTDNVAYNIHDHDIKTDTNEAYGTVNNNDILATATNPAYATTSGSGERHIHTATNEAYISTDFSTSDNPAYAPAEVGGTNTYDCEPVEEHRGSTLVYDYVAT